MAAITPVAASVAPVKIIEDDSGVCSVAITAGQAVILDATTGTLAQAAAAAAGTAGVIGIALESGQIGDTITFLTQGIIDLGLDVLTTLSFGAAVYAANAGGALDSAAGTVSVVVGRVYPGRASSPNDKLLRVHL